MKNRNKEVSAVDTGETGSGPGSLLQPFSLQDVVDVCCYSREAVAKLPDEERIRETCIGDRELKLLDEGCHVLQVRANTDVNVQLDTDEIHVLFLRFVQIESMLGANGTVAMSCIGTAQAEKKKCKDDCKNSKKKFCGCFWNSFLAKADCLVNVGFG